VREYGRRPDDTGGATTNGQSVVGVSLGQQATAPKPLRPRSRFHATGSTNLGLYKILFYFEAFVQESIIMLCPPHLHCPHFCNTVARLLPKIRRPPQPPFCLSYTVRYWLWQYLVKANTNRVELFTHTGAKGRQSNLPQASAPDLGSEKATGEEPHRYRRGSWDPRDASAGWPKDQRLHCGRPGRRYEEFFLLARDRENTSVPLPSS